MKGCGGSGSNWYGLEGNGINKEKSVSLRQRYGKREWLTVARAPMEPAHGAQSKVIVVLESQL